MVTEIPSAGSPIPAGALLDEQPTVVSKHSPAVAGSSGSQGPVPLSGPAELGKTLEGTNLGHFRLEEFVGGGGMGAVFRATDTMLGRTVAVKVLSRDRTDLETLRRFQNEAQSAARLDHENIARVYYVGEDKGLHYIVFEFIQGTNLRDLVVQSGPLPLDEAISYTLQVAEALEHASQRSVVHRDIKPSNVLIMPDRRAKLVDMGLARLHQMGSDAQDLTASGVTLGTFDYISPEQARDPRVADVRSDLYSLGCTLYFMLTGRPPFPEGTVLQKLLSHSSEEPIDPRAVRPDLDEGMVRIIRKLLAKQPSQRHQEPGELIGELLVLAEQLDLSGIMRLGKVWVASRESPVTLVERSLPWAIPAAVFAGVMVTVSFWRSAEPAVPLAQPAPQLLPAAAAAGPLAPTVPPEPTLNGAEAKSPAPADPMRGGSGPKADADSPPRAVQLSPPRPDSPPRNTVAPHPDDPRRASAAPPDAAKPPSETETAKSPSAGEHALPEAPPVVPSGVPVKYFVVGPPDVVPPPNTRAFPSLSAACQEAARTGVSTIELHFDGAREESPLDIAASRLTIRNGPDHHPALVFRPRAEALPADHRMVRIGGGRLTWMGVHVRFELPMEPGEGWSLFHLKHVVSFEMHSSVVTVRNVAPPGGTPQRQVAVFDIEGPAPEVPAPPADSPSESVPPNVRITNCIVRGQAVVFAAAQASPFRAVCQRALVITSERLLDVQGAALKPAVNEPIELELSNVTAVVGQGLGRLSSDEHRPHQLDLVSHCDNCLLDVTDGSAPLLERRGVPASVEATKRWTVTGRDNFYLGSSLLLRIRPPGPGEEPLDFALAARDRVGFDEMNPRLDLTWAARPDPSRTWDTHTAGDFVPDESRLTPADKPLRAGVKLEELPNISEAVGAAVPAVSAPASRP